MQGPGAIAGAGKQGFPVFLTQTMETPRRIIGKGFPAFTYLKTELF